MKFNYPQAIKQQQVIHQAQIQNARGIQQGQTVHHPSQINPSHIQGGPTSERLTTGTSVNVRPSAVIPPNKGNITPSYGTTVRAG